MSRRRVIDNKSGYDVWNGEIASSFDSGIGTASNPYIIKKCNQLARLAQLVNDGNEFYNVYFSLKNNLDLNNINWTPIGYYDKCFNGYFNGNGHIIKNLQCIGTYTFGCASLFGQIGGGINYTTSSVLIYNLIVKDSIVNITGTTNADTKPSVLCCKILNKNIISTCAVINSNVDSISTTYRDLGGIVNTGFGPASIRNCYFSGHVNQSGRNYRAMGGVNCNITGYNNASWGYNYINVANSYNNSDICSRDGGGVNITGEQLKLSAAISFLNNNNNYMQWVTGDAETYGFPKLRQ